MPIPRMTTRRWMIAVAVVGLIVALVVIGGRLRDERELRLMDVDSCDLAADASRKGAEIKNE